MISQELVFYCLLYGAAYIAIATVVIELIGKLTKVRRGIPDSIIEPDSLGTYMTGFMVEFLFYVAVPSLMFAVLYTVVPLSGIRSGLAAALFAFGLGAMPIVIILSLKLKLYLPFMLFQLLGHLIKLGGSLAIISYLYFS